jgi:hypothetical protein
LREAWKGGDGEKLFVFVWVEVVAMEIGVG